MYEMFVAERVDLNVLSGGVFQKTKSEMNSSTPLFIF